jgi:PST family polysaccharide transporter
MKSVLYATSLLSASWFVTLLAGLLSSKVLAVVLEPSGFGYYGLLQNFVELFTMLAGLGIGAALVRSGSSRIAENDQAGISGLREGARLVFIVSGALITIGSVILRKYLSQWFLGAEDHGWSIVFMTIAVLFSLDSYIQVNILNAYHSVKALAHFGAWSKILGAGLAIALVLIWRQSAIVPASIAIAFASWWTARYLLRKEIGPLPVRVPFQHSLRAAWSLLKFGVPFMTSTALSKGTQLLLPILVLHLLNAENVGNYRAASTIAVTYLGFLVTAMTQDYFPRVSAAVQKPHALVELINDQQRLVLLLGAPMILGTIALVRPLIPIVFSSKFNLAADLLEWLMIGDIFRLSSFTMSIVIITRCRPAVYLFTETLSGVTTLATAWLGVRWFGLTGLGIAFLVSNVLYYLVVWTILRGEVDLSWTRLNMRLMLATVCFAIVIRALPFTPVAYLRTPVGVTLAAAACLYSARALWWEIRGKVSQENG